MLQHIASGGNLSGAAHGPRIAQPNENKNEGQSINRPGTKKLHSIWSLRAEILYGQGGETPPK